MLSTHEYLSVDQELDFICNEAKVRSPFPRPSLLHVTPTGVHPDSATKPICNRQLVAPTHHAPIRPGPSLIPRFLLNVSPAHIIYDDTHTVTAPLKLNAL